MIRNVVFDMGQVLIHWNPHLLLTPFHLTPGEEEAVIRELFQSVEWVRLDRGTITEEGAVRAVCERLPETLHTCVREVVTRWHARTLEPMEGMADLLRELKEKGMHIYLLSNANLKLRSYFPRIPGLKAEECFFVDDAPANVEGAMEAGLSGTVFYGDVARLRRELRKAGVPVEP